VLDARAEEPLLEALDDPAAGVRGQAALAIGSLKSQRAVPRLLELTQDSNWFVRVAALNGLGYIDPALPAEPALGALADDEPLVRQAAALNMGGSKDPAAVDMLMEALAHDSDWAVREAAADALGEIGDPRAADSLQRAARLWRVVVSWRVVRAARRALRRIETASSARS
jgi:HEAT repeat protein